MRDPRAILAKRLKEPYSPKDQDWEWVASKSDRVWEYIFLYQKPFVSRAEKEILMEMMLQAVNDIKLEFGYLPRFWLKVRALLLNNISIHAKTIQYWSGIHSFVPMCNSWAIAKQLRVLCTHTVISARVRR